MTLVQLFAWLTETMLYRMNEVPDRNFVKFLELLNLRLEPSKPAKTNALHSQPKTPMRVIRFFSNQRPVLTSLLAR